ncbi:YqaE/Pmp3 family membrane protein [Pontiella sulfatireligans]|uniref:Uncharacterized protein n=1 Tax=Pontiella sulfatireligans TaxID=2750658 RepID=A0A6C2UHB6_9BACT|nr:YqaE/Pmp3 family membrane protein [Pontiella sulfatireligans]VGO18897.1 hypothetical protein SCARR_00950 [Pontiella sulfatireligans]
MSIKNNKLVMVLLAIFISPLAAYFQVGITLHFWVTLALYFLALGWIYALWLVLTDQSA